MRFLISITLCIGVIFVGGIISDHVFDSCPDRASATTDACVNPDIDVLYDEIIEIRLILIPITLVLPFMVLRSRRED
jgi:hypothetical protein